MLPRPLDRGVLRRDSVVTMVGEEERAGTFVCQGLQVALYDCVPVAENGHSLARFAPRLDVLDSCKIKRGSFHLPRTQAILLFVAVVKSAQQEDT